jgi:hypothetical protein
MTKDGKTSSGVLVSDDALVVDVGPAKIPGVVRLKLDALAFAHFHVRSGDSGSTLGFTNDKGEFIVIGVFSDRADADRLLRRIRDELLRLEGYHKFFSLRRFMIFFGVLLALWLVVWVFGKLTEQHLPMTPDAPLAFDGPSLEPPAGVPLDADEKLAIPGK